MSKGILAITRGGEKNFFKVNINSINDLDISNFPSNIKALFGKDDMSRECDFNYKGKTISVFAFNNGVAGKENKFELPPPIDQTIYFGCIIVIAHVDNNISTITPELFDDFYETVFEGFVSLGGSDTWSEEEEEDTDDRDFIVDDDYVEFEEGGEEEEEEEEEYVMSDEDEEEGYICLETESEESNESIKSPSNNTSDSLTENKDDSSDAKIKLKFKISNSK